MGMMQLTIDMPPALRRWIEPQVADGRFVDADDYLRHLVRRDLARAEREGWRPKDGSG
jgi:Arc/MetJ-type ribon-helix-helix transcriptional regulator